MTGSAGKSGGKREFNLVWHQSQQLCIPNSTLLSLKCTTFYYGHWSKVVHYIGHRCQTPWNEFDIYDIGKRVPFGMNTVSEDVSEDVFRMMYLCGHFQTCFNST